MQFRWLVVLVAGCATAGNGEQQQQPDAANVDATVDAPAPDAPPPCMATATTQLLANPAFDASPSGSGWTEDAIDPLYPIITTDDGLTEQSPSRKAWMGGFAQANATDSLHQDVTVPMGTANLVIKGFYAIGTTEAAGAGVKDTAVVELLDGATVVATALAVDNTMPTATWTAIDQAVANPAALSGKTVRVRFRTSNDASAHTNFFFDSLTLTATHCP